MSMFLSYARMDDDRDDKDSHYGWVRYFHSRLSLTLSPKLGRRINFWRDVEEIEKSSKWHDPIKNSLERSAVLVSVLSPSFLQSENCSFELQYFIDHHKHPLESRLAEHVIKVLKHGIDLARLPSEISETEPYTFFYLDKEKGELSYYSTATGLRQDRMQAYQDELERLANRLVTILEGSGNVEPPPLATVFVAAPALESKIRDFYSRIRAELERRHVKVVSSDFSNTPPYALNEIALDQSITNASLSIHLLDSSADHKGYESDVAQLTRAANRVKGTSRLRRIIWVYKPIRELPDSETVSALRRLESRGGLLLDTDCLIEGTFEQFMEQLLRILPSSNDEGTKTETAPQYLLLSPQDIADAESHILPILRSKGMRLRVPPPLKITGAERLAIYWGREDADWVYQAIDRFKHAGEITLVMGPPEIPEKSIFFADEIAKSIRIDFTSAPGD